MAAKASAETVAADMRPPDYRKAVQSIRGVIFPKKDKISSINGEIADGWAKIEGLKVNKRAAKIFAVLDKLDAQDRQDVFRSLNGLVDAAGWDEEATDLVDKAEGVVVQMRVGQPAGPAPEDDEAFDAEIADAMKEDPAPAEPTPADTVAEQAEDRKAKIRSIDSARKDPGADAAPEPFTGDNSDLADL